MKIRQRNPSTTRHIVTRTPGGQWAIQAVTRSSVVLRRKAAKVQGIEFLGDYDNPTQAQAAIETHEKRCADCFGTKSAFRCAEHRQKRADACPDLSVALNGSKAAIEAIDAAKAIVRQAGGRA